MRKRSKVAFVMPPIALPIPAVKGGAIETLMTMLLEENEKEGKYEFVFIAPDKRDIKKEWTHSKVYLISGDSKNPDYVYDNKANRIVRDEKADYLVMEGNACRIDNCFRGAVRKERLAIHLHHEFPRKGVFCDNFGVTISPSRFIAEAWNKEAAENAEKTYILRNAIDINKFNVRLSQGERDRIRRKLGFTKEDIVVIFCGRFIQVKGVKELIGAVLSLPEQHLRLLLVGSDNFKEGNKEAYAFDVIKLAKQVPQKIVHAGYIENEKMYQIYQCADIQVIPSLWEEAFGLVALEAMCSNLPIIYTNSGGLKEIIPDDAGIMIEKEKRVEEQIAEKLEWMIIHPEERARMAKAGYSCVQRYSQKRYYEDFKKMMTWWEKLSAE